MTPACDGLAMKAIASSDQSLGRTENPGSQTLLGNRRPWRRSFRALPQEQSNEKTFVDYRLGERGSHES